MNHDLTAFNFCQVEAMERLAVSEENIVGDIDYIVDRALSDGCQAFFEPFRRFFYGDVSDSQSGITGAGFGIVNTYGRCAVGAVGTESVDRRATERCGDAVATHPSHQVAGDTIVATSVDAVGREVNFDCEVG